MHSNMHQYAILDVVKSMVLKTEISSYILVFCFGRLAENSIVHIFPTIYCVSATDDLIIMFVLVPLASDLPGAPRR